MASSLLCLREHGCIACRPTTAFARHHRLRQSRDARRARSLPSTCGCDHERNEACRPDVGDDSSSIFCGPRLPGRLQLESSPGIASKVAFVATEGTSGAHHEGSASVRAAPACRGWRGPFGDSQADLGMGNPRRGSFPPRLGFPRSKEIIVLTRAPKSQGSRSATGSATQQLTSAPSSTQYLSPDASLFRHARNQPVPAASMCSIR